jgi:hypothetical protein
MGAEEASKRFKKAERKRMHVLYLPSSLRLTEGGSKIVQDHTTLIPLRLILQHHQLHIGQSHSHIVYGHFKMS